MNTLNQNQIAINTSTMNNSEHINFDGMLYDIEELMYQELDNKDLQQIREHIAHTNYAAAAQVARKTNRNNLAMILDGLQEELEVAVAEYIAAQ